MLQPPKFAYLLETILVTQCKSKTGTLAINALILNFVVTSLA